MAVRIWYTDTERIHAETAALIWKRSQRIDEVQPIRYRQQADRLRHQAGIVMAAELVEIPDALPLTVSRGTFGKPFFQTYPEIHFNISHSGRFVVCAVDDAPVGADIQEPAYLPPESWHLFMTDDERQHCSSPEQALRLWSAKEAVSKCIGAGFLRTIPTVGILGSFVEMRMIQHENTNLFLWQQRFAGDYILSAAFCTSETPSVHQFEFVP